MNKRKNIENQINLRKDFWLCLIIFLLASLVILSTYLFKNKVENVFNFSYHQSLSTVIEENGLKVHFIDVGQADATLIEFPNGEIMLIDCGDKSEASHKKFTSYLNKIEFRMEEEEKIIDYLILTHPDEDHIGGAVHIFDNYKVKTCYLPQVYASNETLPTDTSLIVQSKSSIYAAVISSLAEEVASSGCISIRTVQELEISSAGYNPDTAEIDPLNWIVNFYAPIATELPYRKTSDPDDLSPVSNDYSPIMILSYLDKKIMFTGDASDKVEKSFINYYEDFTSIIDFDIDILKLGHHGSRYSTCEDLLNFVTPEYAIASAGLNNQYGHPSSHTVDRLENYGINSNDIYRTDLNGNIIIGISRNGALSLKADHVQYSTFKFEWWMIFLIFEGIAIVVIFLPYTSKYITLLKKKNGSREKTSK